MQDLRAAPRWSKTAVVVVLVVFGLVLVVAVFGLWAFSSDRDLGRQQARERSRRRANGQLESIQQVVTRRFEGLLHRAAEVDSAERLQAIRSSPVHGPLVREIFRLDADDAVRWIDGEYRLFDSPARIKAESESQRVHGDREAKLKEDRRESQLKQGDSGALRVWQKLADGFGLLLRHVGGDSEGYPVGVGYAVRLLQCAASVAESRGEAVSPEVMRRALLRALEIEALNAGRTGVKQPNLEHKLSELRSEMDRLLDRLPAETSSALRWERDRFRRYRAWVGDPLRYATLLAAVRKAQGIGKEGRFVIFEEPELLGVIWGSGEHTLVVRLDLQATKALIEDSIDLDAFARLGTKVELFPLAAEPTMEGNEEPAGSLSLRDRPMDLPFRLAFFRVGDPEGQDGVLSNLLFYVVIALAVAGLATGGFVLIRLLTREIRLATLKADFVSNLSHELKTPITSISLFTEMLDEGKMTDPEEQAEAFSILATESQRLQRTVARMIDVARGEARRNPYELEPGDLNEPVMEAATRFRRITTEPGLELAVSLFPERLPVRMDFQAVDDAVTNLLSNAWKYKRGDRVRITVRTARRGRHAELLVSDDGVGIPRAERRRVFEMFYRSEHFLTHPVAGTGLGLALVRSVVRGHKGSIKVESGEGGRGAAFRLRIPLDLLGVVAEERPPVSAPRSDRPTGAATHGKVGEQAARKEEPARPRASNPGAQP
jgi:two-component system phosphate regulon sensor histidine kinase PhoR